MKVITDYVAWVKTSTPLKYVTKLLVLGSNANSTLSSTIFNTDDSDDNDINGLAKRLTERLHVPILISFHKNFDMLAATVLNLNQTQPKGHLNSASSANIVMYTIELAVYEKLKDLIKSSNVLVI